MILASGTPAWLIWPQTNWALLSMTFLVFLVLIWSACDFAVKRKLERNSIILAGVAIVIGLVVIGLVAFFKAHPYDGS